MRITKTLSLVVVLALSAIAMITAGPASAAALCEENKDPCPEGKAYAPKKIVSATLKAATTALLDTEANATDVECQELEFEGEALTDELGEFTGGKVTTGAFPAAPFPCKTKAVVPVNCGVATSLNLPYSLGVVATGGGNGKLTFSNTATEIECGTAVECTFTLAKAEFEVTGGAIATAKEVSAKLKMEGSKCPKEAEWVADFKINAPAPLFVVSKVAPPVLCKANGSPCTGTDIYGTGTTIKASLTANVKFNYTYSGTAKEPTCTGSEMEGKTTEAGKPIVGDVTKWTFTGCGGGVCAITAQRLPYRFEIERTGSGNGTFTWRNKANGQPAVKIICGGLFEECIYGTSHLTFTLNGGAPAEFFWPTKVALTRESGSSLFCSETATWEGVASQEVNYKITAPNPLYVRS